MNKKIVVVGDSHTRSFAYRDNIIPVFLGSGKFYNTNSKNIDKVRDSVIEVKNKIKEDSIFVLNFGEPDARYSLKKDYDIHKSKFRGRTKINTQFIDKCVSNYKKLVEYLEFETYILSPTSAYIPNIKTLRYFNKELKKVFKDKFLDTYSIVTDKYKAKKHYRNPDYDYDPIHLNSHVSDVFLLKLLEKEPIDVSFYKYLSTPFNCNDVAKQFAQNKFGTYKF